MIQRYDLEKWCDAKCDCSMGEDSSGEFVKFSDAESDKTAALAEKDKEIERRVREINMCYGFQKNQAAEIMKWRDMCERLAKVLADVMADWLLGYEPALSMCDINLARQALSAYNAMKEAGK